MNNLDFLRQIRFDKLVQWFSLDSQSSLKTRRSNSCQTLDYRPLEQRCLLAGIYGISVEVNGTPVELTQQNNHLQLVAGDTIEVTEIGYQSPSVEGVFAAEGYVNKIEGLTSASLIDYADGRFSTANQDATAGAGSLAGLGDHWTVDTGWDRLTISLMHYTSSSASVSDQFSVSIQVGEPDFQFNTSILDQITDQQVFVGDEVTIPGSWTNTMGGVFHNYAEVDIYHSSDMNTILWAGATVGNPGNGHAIEADFLNTRTDDPFTPQWTPELEGEYVLKYYLDPESIVLEADETNNQYEIRLNVSDSEPLVARDDFFAGDFEQLDQLDVLLNDSGQGELFVVDVLQPANGDVTINADGTLNFTPREGFFGTEQFSYSVTNGSDVGQPANVTVEVLQQFEVADASGLEDQPIDLNILTNYSNVQISGVPEGAELSAGKRQSNSEYLVKVLDLDGLQITPAENSDVDFVLTVTPVDENQTLLGGLSQELNVEVNPVVDGGTTQVRDVAIQTGKSKGLTVNWDFADLDGSEFHQITFAGLPEFLSLSAGQFDGQLWTLTADDLDDLTITADYADDTSTWDKSKKNYEKEFDILVLTESTELATGDSILFEDIFTINVKQRI